jgi:type II secretory ATPase GspE/PulE/Tfp pilus assembly ATPase PilB-like protein
VGERQKRIGQILREMELVSEAQIQEALSVQHRQGGVLGEILVRLGYAARDEINLALAAQIGMTMLDIREVPPDVTERTFRWMKGEEVRFDVPDRVPEAIDPLAESEPVAKVLNIILSTALDADATEVRFDSRPERFEIRYRVDGVLHEMESPPRHLAPPLLGRLRLLTGLSDDRPACALKAVFAGRRYRVEAESSGTAGEETVVLRFLPA